MSKSCKRSFYIGLLALKLYIHLLMLLTFPMLSRCSDQFKCFTFVTCYLVIGQKGYNLGQLISDFSFAERTVDAAIKDYKEQGGSETDETKRSEEFDTKALALPAKLDIKQVIAPEYLIKHLSFVDGGQRQTFIDALLVYEAARRSVMEDIVIIQGLASAQAQITDTQIKLLREAKSDSKEVAHAAAERTVFHGKEKQLRFSTSSDVPSYFFVT